ncbi:MAG: lysophospholipase [Planctomycetes bacterium]|nr:lysophospholipase [Planctomycetota bacterium]
MTRIHEPIEVRVSPAEIIRGDLRFTGNPGRDAVVFLHGFGSTRNGEKSAALEEACASTGWTFAAVDCRGHGTSDGTMRDLRGSRLLEDVDAFCDALTSRGIEKFYVVGSSMGGFLAAWYALDAEKVAACVMIAPAFRFIQRRWDSLTEFQRAYWKQAGFVRYKNEWIDVEVGYGLVEERGQYPFEELLSRWSKPALIFHGTADETVPVEDSLEFHRGAAGGAIELRLFGKGGHRLNEHKEEMASHALRFFERVRLASRLASS